MGKKYDAYAKAVEAEKMAKSRLSDVQGGSTEKASVEAIINAAAAELIANTLYQEFMDDPQG